MYNVGDRIEIIVESPDYSGLMPGDTGTIVKVLNDGTNKVLNDGTNDDIYCVTVEFDYGFSRSHDCNGLVKSCNGFWLRNSWFRVVADEDKDTTSEFEIDDDSFEKLLDM